MVLAWRGARWKAVGRNRIARCGKDSIGRVPADREAGAYYARNSKGGVIRIHPGLRGTQRTVLEL